MTPKEAYKICEKQNKIPISKRLFDNFLQLSIYNLRETNKNIFLALNGLEEWII